MFKAIVLGLSVFASSALASTITQVTDFGDNPTGIGMYLYTPDNVAAKPAVVVGVHACHGKGTDVCNSNNAFAQQADKWGFLLICPSAISSDGCWDVHSSQVMTHEGGGDAQGIVSMVRYVLANKNGDASRVFVMGHSSGGMATNILLGSYPELFQAGAAYAGVPFGCFGTGSVDSLGWNTDCAQGKVSMTGEAWGDLVRAAYPGFGGIRPRIQLWHGTTDDILDFQNFKEEIKQWTNVLGVGGTPSTTEANALQPTWIRTRYKDAGGVVRVEAIEETGQPHNLRVDAAEAIRFFGLDGSNPIPDAGAMDGAIDAGAPDAPDARARPDATGGMPATGGLRATGGVVAMGGAVAMGGVPATGGQRATGGVRNTGGAATAGGGVRTGGERATGGAIATGGVATTGGAEATGGMVAPRGSSGCSLGAPVDGRGFPFAWGGLVLGVMMLAGRERRRTRSR